MTKLIIALDLPASGVGALFSRLHRETPVRFFKFDVSMLLDPVGMTLIENINTNCPDVELMLDLKAWGTPDTVHRTVAAAFSLGARFVTVRAGIGDEDSVDAARDVTPVAPCCLLLVGNLTSAPKQANSVVYNDFLDINRSIGAVVPGCDLKRARALHPKAILVVPGVRPAPPDPLPRGYYGDHHQAFGVITPGEAARLGADYVVVGRPIYRAPDPVAATLAILKELEK